ncbi:hypothetical protein D3C78_1112190 [compost metagenome]
MHLLRIVAGGLEVLAGVQLDPVQVVVVQGQAAQRRVGCTGQLPDGRCIEAGEQRTAVGIHPRLSMGVAQHAAILRADRENQHLQAATLQALADPVELAGVGAIGQQHQGAGRAFGFQKAPGLVDHAEHVLPGRIDEVGGQRLQEGIQQRRIVRGRQHHMGAAGIGQQRSARPRPALDEVMQLVLGGGEARGWHVVGIHRGRQVQRQDQRGAIVDEVGTVLLPGRPGGGDRAEHQQDTQQMHRPQATLVPRRDHQQAEQVRGDDAVELAREVMPAQPQQGEQQPRHDQQQPERTQEMEGAEVEIHLRPPLPLAAAAPTIVAPQGPPAPGRPPAGAAPRPAASRTDRAGAGG